MKTYKTPQKSIKQYSVYIKPTHTNSEEHYKNLTTSYFEMVCNISFSIFERTRDTTQRIKYISP